MSTSSLPSMVIVGAGHCGGRAAQALREFGWTGTIDLVGMERHAPYERPPLSKELLTGQKTANACLLRSSQTMIDDGIRLHTQRVAAIDTRARRVTLANGQVLPYLQLLLATGGAARCLDIPGADLPEVLDLRDAFKARGETPSKALQKAVKYVFPATTTKQKTATEVEARHRYPSVAALADAVWDEARSGHVAAGSFGEYVLADATRVSGDATAADNLEAMVDGTGLTLTGVVVPSVTTVTGNVNGSVASVTGAVGSVTGLTASDVGAIKTKTDSLTFTSANMVDANIQRVNDVLVTGNGQAGTEWGP